MLKLVWIAMLVFGVTAVLVRPALSAPDANALLALHARFVGWKYGDGTVRTVKLRGHTATRSVSEVWRGALFRQQWRENRTLRERGLGYDARGYWFANESGFRVPIVGDRGRILISQTFLQTEAFTGLPATLQGDETIGGVATQIVRVTPPNGVPMDLAIDPASGRLLRAVLAPDDARLHIEISRYVEFESGKRIMADIKSGSNAIVYDSVEVNGQFTETELAAPVPREHWSFAANSSIPIDISRKSVRFHASVNGVEGYFLLDTGASGIFLNEAFARKAAVKMNSRTMVSAIGATIDAQMGSAERIAVGANVLHDAVVVAGTRIEGADGVMGFDFLAGAVVDVDFQKKMMTLFDPTTTTISENQGGLVLYTDLTSGTPAIGVTFNRTRKAHLTLDSGNSAAVIVAEDLRTQMLPNTKTQFRVVVRGAGSLGGVELSCGRVPSIEIGPVVYKDVGVCFGGPGNDGGLLGYDLMRHFNWTFDYPDGQILLTPFE